MKRLMICLVAALGFAAAVWAQMPEEILSRMEKAMQPADEKGMSMAMDIKIPIIGTTSTKMYILGDKVKTLTVFLGEQLVTYSDGTTQWEYDPVNNELTISLVEQDDEASEAALFSGITDGYDVTLKKETAEAWHLQCNKARSNKNEDDPDKMDLLVSKKTNLPLSLSTRISGMRMTLRDVVIGISPALMRFDPGDYPDAKIIDKR